MPQGFFIMEDEIVGDTTHGDRLGLTFYFNDEATYKRVFETYRRSERSQYMNSRKLALTVIPEGELPNVV